MDVSVSMVSQDGIQMATETETTEIKLELNQKNEGAEQGNRADS